MELICPVEVLANELGNPQWLVFDCRFSLTDSGAGLLAYNKSHIPGARFVDLNSDLSGPHIPGKTGRHPLPDKARWIERITSWGIDPDKQVIAYDDAGGAGAARLWWMLRWAGHEKVAVLDGGWQAWLSHSLPLSETVPPPAVSAESDYLHKAPLTREVLAEQLPSVRFRVLDARDEPRYRGEEEPLDPVAGHIPGSFCSPFRDNLTDEGTFKSSRRLREKFSAHAGVKDSIVCYCGSGVTATHNILALKLAGYPEPALYAGSWSEWITDPERPVAKGEHEQGV